MAVDLSGCCHLETPYPSATKIPLPTGSVSTLLVGHGESSGSVGLPGPMVASV